MQSWFHHRMGLLDVVQQWHELLMWKEVHQTKYVHCQFDSPMIDTV